MTDRILSLNDNIQYLKGVGQARAKLFNKLGVDSVGSLVSLYPRAYEDWKHTVSILDAEPDKLCCIKATVCAPVKKAMIRQGLTIYKTSVTDGENVMGITIFNSAYAAEKLKNYEEYLFFGKVTANGFTREMSSPKIEPVITGERIRPIYPQTQNLTSTVIERCVKRALEGLKEFPPDILSEEIRLKYALCDYKTALESIHFPANESDMLAARRRLSFEELYVLQIGLLLLRGRNRKRAGCRIYRDFTKEFFSLLPFTPTGAQQRAVAQAVADMARDVPMSRLLQGDVGSGKTAVAAALSFNCAKNGFQTAIMAPTEILAQQHFKTFTGLLKGTQLRTALLIGSTNAREKKEIKEKLKCGEIDIIIGTHALIQNDVEFKNLGLVVTDEQHRFGVGQRSSLGEKGKNPHTLVMSATPIPRTLALIIYGDLDVSVLDELPAGRQKIETFAIEGSIRRRAYGYVKQHLDQGRQGYIICPLVEESEALDLAAAEEYARRIANNDFAGYSVGLLHGKMKPKEKETVMSRFAAGDIQLLVSTTVVEVGVDVPNSVIMVIENAERFGLSQLHQLRGRVGRGEHKSTCILISDAKGGTARQRLKTMCKTTDGFKIADEDLKLRGPGDFFGARQHGLPQMKIADLSGDMELLKQAQQAAQATLKNDPALRSEKNSTLKAAVLELFERMNP